MCHRALQELRAGPYRRLLLTGSEAAREQFVTWFNSFDASLRAVLGDNILLVNDDRHYVEASAQSSLPIVRVEYRHGVVYKPFTFELVGCAAGAKCGYLYLHCQTEATIVVFAAEGCVAGGWQCHQC
jgi:hypothetical protein